MHALEVVWCLNVTSRLCDSLAIVRHSDIFHLFFNEHSVYFEIFSW